MGEHGKTLPGKLKVGRFDDRDSCAKECSLNAKTTACEFDIAEGTCKIYTEIVTGVNTYHTPLGTDTNKICLMFQPKGI